MRVDRRHLLAGMAALGAEAFAVGIAGAQGRPIIEKAPPKDLNETTDYFHHASEGSMTDEKGVTLHQTRLKENDIFVAFTQKIEIDGTGWVYEVDSTNHPEQGLVVAILCSKTETPDNVGNFKYKQFPHRYVWKTREVTRAKGFEAKVADAIRAGEVQVDRAQIPGNCTPEGCKVTRLVVLNAHEEWVDSKAVMKYDLVKDEDWKKTS